LSRARALTGADAAANLGATVVTLAGAGTPAKTSDSAMLTAQAPSTVVAGFRSLTAGLVWIALAIRGPGSRGRMRGHA
jgi:hypothetical protein